MTDTQGFQHQDLDNFHGAFDASLKTRIVDMSKLLCEVWLKSERGEKFKEALKTKNVKEALAECNISFPDDFVQFELDTSTYNGSIEILEELHRGLTFQWKLPYASWPEKGVTEAEIHSWIKTTDEWLQSGDPNQDLPTPPNIYIPLATL
jgi:hypothetical protein